MTNSNSAGVFGRWIALSVALTLLACGPSEGDKPPKDAGGATSDATVDAGDTQQAKDQVSGSDTSGAEVSGDVSVDTGPSKATCAVAADCIGKVELKACEELVCEDGFCAAALKPGQCCTDKDCDDGKECTQDLCDSAQQSCQYVKKVNCCSGKLTLAKIGFDSGGLGDLISAVTSGAGGTAPVSWTVSDKRARIGDKALYLGNACGNYATNADPANDCAISGDAEPVVATLDTKSVSLPADKDTQLHFWLWKQVEPSYTTSLPPGTCTPPCAVGSACVNVNGASQCIPEKDVLTVSVQLASGVTKVFDSSSFGKSTGDGWKHVAIDLSAYAGQSVKLTWRFETGTGLKNEFEGVWLDEIVLETVCPVQGTLCDSATPCLDDNQACTADDCTWYSNTGGKGFCFHDKSEGCCTVASECDDGEGCTVDTCDNGVCKSKPDLNQPGCCKSATQLFDDFDSGVLTDWTLIDGNSTVVQWRVDPSGGLQGSQAMYFGNSNFSGYHDASLPKGEGPKGTACSKPVLLPSGTLYNQVVFHLQMQTEWSYLPSGQYKNPPLAGQPKYDHLNVWVKHNGKPHPVWSSDLTYGTTDGKWHEVVISLLKWQGEQVQVCLTFEAGDDKVNDKKGVHVDNFTVRTACEQKECYYDVDCNLSCGSCQIPGCLDTGCACVALPGCCTATADCDDGDPCTIPQCIQGQCKNDKKSDCCTKDTDCLSTKVCDQAICDVATQKCTTKPVDNCCVDDKDCKPKDACSKSSCDILKSLCLQEPIKGCCLADKDCDDQNPCTKDTCTQNKCTNKVSAGPGCP